MKKKRFKGIKVISEKQLEYAQKKVMEGYRRRGAVKSPYEELTLHMFFSPFRVPKRMTNDEVKVCLLLSALKPDRKPTRVPFGEPTILPHLLPSSLLRQEMTRRSFRRGVWEFLRTRTP